MTINLLYFFYNKKGDYMTIYLDNVFILNFTFDAFLLFTVAIILKRKTSFKRILLGSLVGSLTIIFLFFNLNNYLLFIVKIIFAILMILTSFGYHNLKYTCNNLFYLITTSILLGGFLYLINIEYSYDNTGLIFYSNGLSLNFIMSLIIAPLALYIYIKQTKQLKNNYSNYYDIIIYFKDGKKIETIGFLDTGNNLYDPIKKRPIILINKNMVKIDYKNILLVPYDTIDSHGLLKCIIIDKIEIKGIGTKKNILLGLSEKKITINDAQVILHKQIMEGINENIIIN